jgi:hypothetical protein
MSHYLQRLVERADAGVRPLSGLELTGPLESGFAGEADPFETVGESVASIAPAPRGETVIRAKHVPHEPAPQQRSEEYPEHLDMPVGTARIAPRAEPEPPRIERHPESSEPRITPPELIATAPPATPSVSQMETPSAPGPEPRQPTLQEPRLESARAVMEPPEHLFAYPPAPREESEVRQPHETPREPVETDLPEFAAAPLQPKRSEPIRLDAPPARQMRETTPEPDPEPRLEIGHLQVEVVPAQPPVREVVRVVSRAPAARRNAGMSSKLRFGLGQM